MEHLRQLTKNLPSLITAFILAVAVWILAVNSTDPSVEKAYPSSVKVEVIGQASNLVITNTLPETISLTLRAPNSIWNQLINEKAPVRALVDLSGISAGSHTVPVQVQIGVKPVDIVSFNPRSLNITLENLMTKTFTIKLDERGDPAVGYQTVTPTISDTEATISGPESQVNRVAVVKAVLDISGVKEDVSRAITLTAVDVNGSTISGVTITPEKINLTQAVVQRGGYRNVVVKVNTVGQIASGYRLTNISVFPPAITIYSTDPNVVDALPDFIETLPLDLTGLKDDYDSEIGFSLPSGVEIIGDQTVNVQVGVAAIESSMALSDVTVEPSGLAANLEAKITPGNVDIIVGGPLRSLDTINISDLRVLIDLSGKMPGKYIITPDARLNLPDLTIENILPKTFDVVIYLKGTNPTP